MSIASYIQQLASAAKQASSAIASASTEQKNEALFRIAQLLVESEAQIIWENELDLKKAQENNLDAAMIDRLKISAGTIAAMAEGLAQMIKLPDPIGEITDLAFRPSGIQVGKMRAPLGVIGMIYESRPNVTIDAAGLCLKSGNACILRGGSEAFHSNIILASLIKEGLAQAGLPEGVVQVVNNTDRESISALLALPDLIDVIIPRGGKGLIKKVSEEARMPVIKHLDGNCHVYIDEGADCHMALNIVLNAKTHRYGTCNTMETLLVNKNIASSVLPMIRQALQEKEVLLHGCEQTVVLFDDEISIATEEDWFAEYLAPELAIKIVHNLDEAIEHINHYGSHHTDSIITNNLTHTQRFLREVDSASVMVNASTRFADGFEYGLGAEMGISTDKFHARGPVGLEGLTSQKWVVIGSGQVRK